MSALQNSARSIMIRTLSKRRNPESRYGDPGFLGYVKNQRQYQNNNAFTYLAAFCSLLFYFFSFFMSTPVLRDIS